MHTTLILWLLALLKCVHCGLRNSSFATVVTADDFVYRVVNIPRYATQLKIRIWAESGGLRPTVLMRYDGLPTSEVYDARLTVPGMPGDVLVIDAAPTQGSLYFALFGGTEINRYRYFAGSPEMIVMGVEASVQSCRNEYQRGMDCITATPLTRGLTISTTALAVRPQYYTIFVPTEQEYLLVTLNSLRLIHDICEKLPANATGPALHLVLDLYMDQPDEDFNSARQSALINTTSLCAQYQAAISTGLETTNLVLSAFAPRPLPGLWTVRLSLLDSDNATLVTNSAQTQRDRDRRRRLVISASEERLPTQKQVQFNDTALDVTLMAETGECPDGYTNARHYNLSEVAARDWPRVRQLQCIAPVVGMAASATPLIADGFYSLQSGPVAFTNVSHSSDSGALASPFVVFTADVPQRVRPTIVGGGMAIEVEVALPPALEDTMTLREFLTLLDAVRFTCAARVGNFPEDPSVSLAWESELDTALSLNAFVLYSRDAKVRDGRLESDSAASDDDDGGSLDSRFPSRHGNADRPTGAEALYQELDAGRTTHSAATGNHYRKFSWTVTRPYIPALMSTGAGMTSEGPPLYLRVAVDGEVSAASRELISHLQVSAALVVEPCPRGSCVHGTCFTQLGDVPASSCSCRYPWIGESCDRMSIPYPLLVVQMLLLVLSNLAMLPAVLACRANAYYFLATLLSVSATASGVYHLCDSDVYCLLGLPFYSLQVLDVLMSLASISSALLLYAPISKHTHSSLSLLCLCILVAFVSSNPTSPMNIAVAGGFAVAACAVGWLVVHGAGGEESKMIAGCSLRAFHEQTRDGFTSSAGNRAGVGASSTVYSALPTRSVHCGDSGDGGDGGDVEMTQHGVNPLHSSVMEDNTEAATQDSRRSWGSQILVPLGGMLAGLLGLTAFALQGRDNYYIVHSVWHVCMMAAAYLLVFGRLSLSHSAPGRT